jgi:hypothetical protein
MSGHAMTRRQLLASGASATTALVLSRFAAAAGTFSGDPTEVSTFYDPRFPASRILADALPGALQLQAAPGDPLQLLSQIRDGGNRSRPRRLQGVTTETLPFCLEQMARRHHEVRFESQRIDRDLFAWSLEMHPRASAV